MDRATAIKVLDSCSLAFEPLNNILLDRSPDLSDEDFATLRHSVADVLAYLFDLLIEPTIAEHPDLNRFDRTNG